VREWEKKMAKKPLSEQLNDAVEAILAGGPTEIVAYQLYLA
jgi:hypothetical protein